MFLKLLIHSLLINIPIAKTSLIWNGGSKENITVNVDKFCYVKLTTPARNEIKFKENRDERESARAQYPSVEKEGSKARHVVFTYFFLGNRLVVLVLFSSCTVRSTAHRRDTTPPPHVRLLTFCMVAHLHLLRRAVVPLLLE